jgi:CHAT domain-containing protein
MSSNLPIEFWMLLLDINNMVEFLSGLFILLDYQQVLSNIVVMEEFSSRGFSLITSKIVSKRRTLHVSWNSRLAELSYSVFSPDPMEEEREWVQLIPDHSQQIVSFWDKLNHIFSDAIPKEKSSEDSLNSARLTLQGLGQKLFDSLIPQYLAKIIKAWESGLSVRISTNEQWIPWELMYDGEKFLGDKFIFTRCPRLKKERRCISNRKKSLPQESREIKKIVNIIGGGIRKTHAIKASTLFDNLSPSIVVNILKEQTVSCLVEAVDEADILHFTCHGHLKPLNLLQNFLDKTPSNNLCLDTVQQLQIKPGTFVFANACSSTAPVQESFSEFNGFGWEFYQEGADVFIGTLGLVPTQYAIIFAENVYDGLLQKNGKLTIGEAVANAKKMAATKQNFFWLLYCVYGDPDFCF